MLSASSGDVVRVSAESVRGAVGAVRLGHRNTIPTGIARALHEKGRIFDGEAGVH